jgi:A/G-specific adenine glycosylase
VLVEAQKIVVAEVLLQSTFAEKVEPVFANLITEYPTPVELAKADEQELADLLEPLGLQNRKARWLISIGDLAAEEGIPTSYDELLNLPGLGPYAANAVLCFGHGERRPIVDTNVIRLYNRIFSRDFQEAENDDAWDFARTVLPEEDYAQFNLALLDLGAAICTDSNPECPKCPIKDYCEYYGAKV